MKTTPEQRSALKALAESTTPGPWRVQHPNAGYRGYEVADATGLEQIIADLTVDRAHYIAAANPDSTLALLADLEEAGARITQLEIAAVNRRVSSKESSALFALGSVQEELDATRKQLEEAQAKLAAAEKDAARYHHARDCNSSSIMLVRYWSGEEEVLTGLYADDEIDAAIAAQEGSDA